MAKPNCVCVVRVRSPLPRRNCLGCRSWLSPGLSFHSYGVLELQEMLPAANVSVHGSGARWLKKRSIVAYIYNEAQCYQQWFPCCRELNRSSTEYSNDLYCFFVSLLIQSCILQTLFVCFSGPTVLPWGGTSVRLPFRWCRDKLFWWGGGGGWKREEGEHVFWNIKINLQNIFERCF